MSIVSVSTIKEYLPELAGSTGADTDLTALRDRVETAVARYLGFPAPDGSLNPVINPIKGPNEVFKGSQDEVFLKELKMRADKDPNDLSLQEELDSMTLILYNKYGDAELSAGMAGW